MDVDIAVSPDADDRFMVWALVNRRVDLGPFRTRVRFADTQALNEAAASDHPPHVCAISAAAWPRLAHRYDLLPHGSSFGDGYGPVVIASEPMSVDGLRGLRMAIPGAQTTAWLVAQLLLPPVLPTVVPIVPNGAAFEALRTGRVDAALLIHEGRMTFAEQGFHQVVDLGAAWTSATGTPLPLGANALRRDLSRDARLGLSRLMRRALAAARRHRDEAIAWILAEGSPLTSPSAVSAYLDLYANARTWDPRADGRAAWVGLLSRARAVGLAPSGPPPTFADDGYEG